MIVLIDEVDLPWGMLRIRERGSTGTHNGLKSIIGSLGTDDFIRVRMGVQPEKIWGDRKDYVLAQMGRAEREIAEQMATEAAEAVEVDFDRGRRQGDVAIQPPGAAGRRRFGVSRLR